MASVELTGLWIHDAFVHSDYVWLHPLLEASITPAKEGEVVELSGGRLVYRGRPTVRQTYTAQVRVNSRTERDLVTAFVGQPVMIRDGVGHKLFGVFHTAPMAELKGIDKRDLTVTVESLTISEEV